MQSAWSSVCIQQALNKCLASDPLGDGGKASQQWPQGQKSLFYTTWGQGYGWSGPRGQEGQSYRCSAVPQSMRMISKAEVGSRVPSIKGAGKRCRGGRSEGGEEKSDGGALAYE